MTYSNYTATHLPQTITDAAGQSTALTYNATGQMLTVTNAKGETSTNVFDANGFLQSVTRPVTGATTTYTYDSIGRTRTVTDSDGYVVTLDYDALDRPTRTTYPDTTYDEIVYGKLDAVRRRDRLGRWGYTRYDAMRRVTATTDPAGRTIHQVWCACGSRDALIDAKGQRTSWQRDVQARVTSEVRADGTTATIYAYETTTGRLKTVTDPKQQVTTYTYHVDDTLQSVAFTNVVVATPSVSYTYDSAYKRVATMVDGTGTTSYGYHSVGVIGAGQLASVDGPLSADTITHGYDELGRMTTRAINGIGTTQAFDALERVSIEVNPLGTFTFAYDGTSPRLASVLYPNGQSTIYTYFGNLNDHRLQTIEHRRMGGATLSKFDYTYDVAGNIRSWLQQADSDPATRWEYTYDAADQLQTAIQRSTGVTPTVLKRHGYTYDAVGNRTTEQTDDAVRASTHDVTNRLVQQNPGGMLRFAGTVNEPATVTIQGRPALVTPINAFSGTAPVATGTNIVSIQATDPNGNVATAQYQVEATGGTKTFSFDANGNLTSDGVRTFEWDAADRLVSMAGGTHRIDYVYDGFGRRVRATEREGTTVLNDTRLLWCHLRLCETRDLAGNVLSRILPHGFERNGAARFATQDHAFSTREVSDSAGVLTARYEYDPFGRSTRTEGTEDAPMGFGEMMTEQSSDLLFTPARLYDTRTGRWLSEDPTSLADGVNMYRYVHNNPLALIDPKGTASLSIDGPHYQRISDRDAHIRACRGRKGRGCTSLRGDLTCVCVKDECRYRPKIDIAARINVYVWDHPNAGFPPETIEFEETKHVTATIAILKWAKAASDEFEKNRYRFYSQCALNCWVFKNIILGVLIAEDPWTHTTNGHPY